MLSLRQFLAVVLVGTPLLIVAMEGALWLIGVAPHPRVLVDPTTCYAEFEPGSHFSHTKQGLVHDLWLDDNGFRVGRDVIRNEEPPTDRGTPEGTCRILALGDSFTEGFFVSAAQTWPGQLEQMLRSDGFDVRVDNGGFRGRSIINEQFAALRRWRSLQHDLVVLEHTSNDIEDLVFDQRQGCVAPRLGVLHESRLYRVAVEVRARVTSTEQVARREGPTREECESMTAEYADRLVSTAQGVVGEGRAFLFVLMEQFRCSAIPDFPWEQYEDGLRTRLVATGASLVDVTDALRVPGRNLAPIDMHPNPAGYAALAKGIAGQIARSGAIEHCRMREPR